MTVWTMSLTGGVFILAVLAVRALFQNVVPRRTFLVLWLAANALLLIPLRPVLPVSIYGFAGQSAAAQPAVQQAVPAAAASMPWQRCVWLLGAIVLAMTVLIAHGRNLLRFRRAVPAAKRPDLLPDRVRLKVLPELPSPLVCGVLRPTILIPAEDFAPPEQLRHVYLHELCHICHLDVLRRYGMLAALAVHWFNPLVWVMYFVASQDLEMRCDEQAIRELGTKKPYAATLVAMETRKLHHILDAGFSYSFTGSRLRAIRKAKRLPVLSAALALTLCACVLAVFATSPPAPVPVPEAARVSAPESAAHPPEPKPLSKPEPIAEPAREQKPEPVPEPVPEPEPEPEPEPAALVLEEPAPPQPSGAPAQAAPVTPEPAPEADPAQADVPTGPPEDDSGGVSAPEAAPETTDFVQITPELVQVYGPPTSAGQALADQEKERQERIYQELYEARQEAQSAASAAASWDQPYPPGGVITAADIEA